VKWYSFPSLFYREKLQVWHLIACYFLMSIKPEPPSNSYKKLTFYVCKLYFFCLFSQNYENSISAVSVVMKRNLWLWYICCYSGSLDQNKQHFIFRMIDFVFQMSLHGQSIEIGDKSKKSTRWTQYGWYFGIISILLQWWGQHIYIVILT